MVKNKFFVGKVSRRIDKTSPRNCKVFVTWEVSDDGRFSMQAEVWNHIETDIIMGGQCVDTVADLFPHNKKLQRMRAIWERWHLNDMKAGSAVQEEYLRNNPVSAAVYPESHYEKASAALTSAGLNPDANGYQYGHAWCREELPVDVLTEIQSWTKET